MKLPRSQETTHSLATEPLSDALPTGNLRAVEDLGDRVWRAYLALPRDDNGEPPPYAEVEKTHGISYATLSKIINGDRSEVRGATVAKLAAALRVAEGWLLTGANPPPLPPPDRPRPYAKKRATGTKATGKSSEFPALRTTHLDSDEAWREAAREAGHNPDDPLVAEVFQRTFQGALDMASTLADRELAARRAAAKGKAASEHDSTDAAEEAERQAMEQGRKGSKGKKSQ